MPRFSLLIIIILICLLFTTPCNSNNSKLQDSNKIPNADTVLNTKGAIVDDYLVHVTGCASYYAHKFHNRKTASGERFDMYNYTAAHRKLPFGSIIKVTNLANNKSILVKITDRGPHRKNRILDLSYRAAKSIDGLRLPKVSITHFDYQKLITKFDTNYFIGHSDSRNFIISHRSEIKFLDSIPSKNFEEVINSFRKYEQIPDTKCYIFTKICKPKKQDIFYIGTSI